MNMKLYKTKHYMLPPASQAGGREFESRFPLLKTSKLHFQ